MMFKWIGGSRQLSQGCTLLLFNVDRETGDFRGKFDVYQRACSPSERKKFNVWHISWGGGVSSCTFYSRGIRLITPNKVSLLNLPLLDNQCSQSFPNTVSYCFHMTNLSTGTMPALFPHLNYPHASQYTLAHTSQRRYLHIHCIQSRQS